VRVQALNGTGVVDVILQMLPFVGQIFRQGLNQTHEVHTHCILRELKASAFVALKFNRAEKSQQASQLL
jgi:hypothetical protein